MKLADSGTIREIDRRSERDFSIKTLQLMENAGRGAAEVIKRELSGVSAPKKVSIIAGKGNNGGDGFVAARHLRNSGISASVYLLARPEDVKGDAGANLSAWRKMNGEVFTILSVDDLRKYEAALRHSHVIADAIFGTGLSAAVAGVHAEVINLINSLKKKTVAIDIPSGVDADTGRVPGAAVRADITATMALPKIGLYVYPGRDYSGRVEVVDIGSPRELTENPSIRWNLITGDWLKTFLKRRKADSHKSSYGHLLVIAGSPGMTGAACMAGEAAMRIGAGLTTIALPESLNPIMEVKTTEVMTIGVPETADRTVGPESWGRIKDALANKTAVLIGPGLGNKKGVFELIEKLVTDIEAPFIIDADGLNAVAKDLSVLKGRKAEVILTPHPGEMSRLLQTTINEVQANRLSSAERLSEMTGATVVLKGAGTIIAGKGQVFINPTGNPGLATAGTGDILAGMIGGLLAQGYGPVDAASAGAYIHGMAGDAVKELNGEAGMVATDLLAHIPKLLNSLIAPSL